MIGLVLVIGIVVLSAYYLSNDKKLYGNDEGSIQKVIQSIEGYENRQIEILDISDFHDSRVVGFLSDQRRGILSLLEIPKGTMNGNI